MGIKGFRRKKTARGVATFFPTFATRFSEFSEKVEMEDDSSSKKTSNPDLAGIPHESLSSSRVYAAKNTPIRGLTGSNIFY